MFLNYLLKNSDFSSLSRLISHEFFKVISPAILFQLGMKLQQNRSDTRTWDTLRTSLASSLAKSNLGVQLEPHPKTETDLHDGAAQTRQIQGEKLLTLFFYQIFTQETWILDFRAESF